MRAVRKMKVKHYTRQVLVYLLAAGILTLADGGPTVGWKVSKKIFSASNAGKKKKSDTFRYLSKEGLLNGGGKATIL